MGRVGMQAAFPLLAILFCGCSGILRTVPPWESYDYLDNNSNRYHLNMENGVIGGISSRTLSSGDTVEILRWTPKVDVQRKNRWKAVHYFQLDTLHVSESTRKRRDGCGESAPRQARGADAFVKVSRQNRKATAGIYRRYSKIHRFGGEVKFQFAVDSAGAIDHIYLVKNTSGDHDFALSLLEFVNGWRFHPLASPCLEIVEMSFWFRP